MTNFWDNLDRFADRIVRATSSPFPEARSPVPFHRTVSATAPKYSERALVCQVVEWRNARLSCILIL